MAGPPARPDGALLPNAENHLPGEGSGKNRQCWAAGRPRCYGNRGGGGGKRETHTSAHARGKGRAVRRREGGAGGDMAAEAGQAVTGEGWRPSGSSV